MPFIAIFSKLENLFFAASLAFFHAIENCSPPIALGLSNDWVIAEYKFAALISGCLAISPKFGVFKSKSFCLIAIATSGVTVLGFILKIVLIILSSSLFNGLTFIFSPSLPTATTPFFNSSARFTTPVKSSVTFLSLAKTLAAS